MFLCLCVSVSYFFVACLFVCWHFKKREIKCLQLCGLWGGEDLVGTGGGEQHKERILSEKYFNNEKSA